MTTDNKLKNKTETTDNAISLSCGLAYSSPVIATTFLIGPIAVLQGVYAKYFGLTLTSIAIVLFIGRLVDAITDPVIGYFSDRSYARTGTRKPFIISGAILLIFSAYFLFSPSDFFNISNFDTASTDYPSVSNGYFLICLLMFYCAWTLFEIPHLAWGGELAQTSLDKSKIYSLRALSTHIGGLLFFTIPLLPFFETNEITPLTLQWSVLIASIIVLPLLYVSIKKTPDKNPYNSITIDNQKEEKSESIRDLLKALYKNKPFLLFITAFLFAGIGSGSMSTMYFFFIDSYLGLGDKFALISIISMLVGIPSLGLWYKLSASIGKQKAWILAMIIMTISLAGFSLLTPGDSSYVPLIILMVLATCGSTALVVIPASVLADIVDYGTWKFGGNHAACYFSVYTLFAKANIALGGAIGLATAGWYGFNATAVTHSKESILGLHLSISYIPAILFVIATFFIIQIPINEKRHAYFRRRINDRTKLAYSALKKNTIQTKKKQTLFFIL